MRHAGALVGLLGLIALPSCAHLYLPAAHASIASAVPKATIDALVEREMAARGIVGASLAVILNGQIVHMQGYGFANLEPRTRATTQTRFYLASMTKMFAATAVMLLVKEERLYLDQEVGNVLGGLPEPWRTVTIRQLLNHTSGIPGFTEFEDSFPCPTTKAVRDYVMGDVLEEVACLPLAFAPGSDFLYSETNYHLLAMIVAASSGGTYEDFVHLRILQPLGMHNTDFLKQPDEPDHRATGYARLDGGNVETPELIHAVELSLVSTVGDLAIFDQALSANSLLPQDVRESMWAAAGIGNARYGLGFSSRPINGRRQVGHTGGGPAAATSFARFPDDDLTIILLTNTGQTPGSIQTLVGAIADELLGKP